MANTVGTDDPFQANAWHLKNTGPTQVVSAADNSKAVAGIDSRVEGVHKGGTGCTGKAVVVAIVDSGLELAHEDIAPNVLANKSFNFANNTSDPSPTANQASVDHGTGVGGIAAARGWNGKGSRGTAPFASLVGYNTVGITAVASSGADVDGNMNFLAFGARAKADAAVAATGLFADRADKVDVFNYSAGADYAAPAAVSADPLGASTQHRAMAYGTQTLRGGKGAVYFQAAGNEFQSLKAKLTPDAAQSSDVNCADFRKNHAAGVFTNLEALTCGSPNHEPENKPYAYQVAAIANSGMAATYSAAGSSVWVTGFGGENGQAEAAIITTDNSSCSSGSNNAANKSTFQAALDNFIKAIADLFGDSTVDPGCNYTGQMNGTSSAAPSVSGVAALVLEANPALTWQDVGYILAKTSRKVDDTIAADTRAVSFKMNGAAEGVTLDLPWLTNKAGFNFSSRYGFGLVDAEAAVRLASAYTAPAGRRADSVVAVGGDSATDAASDGRNGLKNFAATVKVGDASQVTGQIQVDIDLKNTGATPINPGLLQFELVNKATGTVSILMPAFTAWYAGGDLQKLPQNGQKLFRLHSNAFYGEALGADFEVRVRSFVAVSGGVSHALTFKPTITSFSL
ncbi:subtilase family protease [Burkholderiales bacterium JOSHI_001]|nr:subtilase family protease [Burkholderiales bacterium JOSHI_001]